MARVSELEDHCRSKRASECGSVNEPYYHELELQCLVFRKKSLLENECPPTPRENGTMTGTWSHALVGLFMGGCGFVVGLLWICCGFVGCWGFVVGL